MSLAYRADRSRKVMIRPGERVTNMQNIYNKMTFKEKLALAKNGLFPIRLKRDIDHVKITPTKLMIYTQRKMNIKPLKLLKGGELL